VVESLSCLRILDLTNNRLSSLPPGLARLSYMKAIGLKQNCLRAVPKVLGQMRSLQEIYLEDNSDLEITEPLYFLEELPYLERVMMGKRVGSWDSQSMHYMVEFAASLKLRHPTKTILQVSYPGQPVPQASAQQDQPGRTRLLS
jgi:hypothetical protein